MIRAHPLHVVLAIEAATGIAALYGNLVMCGVTCP